jgi:hypothetical protein
MGLLGDTGNCGTGRVTNRIVLVDVVVDAAVVRGLVVMGVLWLYVILVFPPFPRLWRCLRAYIASLAVVAEKLMSGSRIAVKGYFTSIDDGGSQCDLQSDEVLRMGSYLPGRLCSL